MLLSASLHAPRAPTRVDLHSLVSMRRQIRDVIPAHCFEHSLLTSFGYVAHDFFFTALFMYLGIQVDSLDVHIALKIALWSVCVGIQGLFMTGIWMVSLSCRS